MTANRATVWNEQTNFSMLTDFYELTMSQGYLDQGREDEIAYFDLYFRHVPENGGYALMAGVEQMIDYLEHLHFDEADLDFLRQTGQFKENFLNYLANFKFSCDVWAIPEGTVLFPNEPLVKVRGPIIQAQMIETMLLLTINHQSLIATKASRIVRAAQGRSVLELGARRAQGYDASVLGARAAYIGGVSSTSCTICGPHFGLPLAGTMAHSFVQLFDQEFDAFKAYAESYPDNTYLLVDTYNVLRSGVPHAIRCAKEVLEPKGHRLKGIRIDSGDLTYLTQQARHQLDAAGLKDCQIVVSNALDEYLIRDLLLQGAAIDAFGVGERLITSRAEPVFGGVYKLAGVEKEGQILPKMKISENHSKVTNPGSKEVWRFYDRDSKKALADLLTLTGESIDENAPYEIFDPVNTWKRKTLEHFRVRSLLEPIFKQGKLVAKRRNIEEIRQSCQLELESIWDSIKRFENPQTYYVDLSQELWTLKEKLLRQKYSTVDFLA